MILRLINGLAMLAIIIGVAVFVLVETKPASSPLRYPVPQQVMAPGPFQAGDTIPIRGIKCNDSDKAIGFTGTATWRSVHEGRVIPFTSVSSGVVIVLPANSCSDREFANQLPYPMAPGRWTLQGNDCIFPEGEPCAYWYSEEFEIVP